MASLPVPDEAVNLHESVVRGHHVYKRVWSPVVGEILQLSCEEDNDHDRFSVSVMKAEFVVGHSPLLSGVRPIDTEWRSEGRTQKSLFARTHF